uniref:Retrotransposon gag domain-containing protein n=1 Tax=Vitis vinifera TaxID=29760 RepID=A5BKB7_VITVI|nr:hypothetical protein VITISV_001839 [Vitis vinifera]
MSGSNVEETSEQTRGRETEPTVRGRGKKDKSRDAVAMEARLAKVELAMTDTREGLDLIEQGMEKGLEDLREQIQDLRERVLVSQVQPVSHKEFVSFQGKVLSMLASMESRIEALATRMESRDQEVRQELAIYKAAVSAWVMATQEASRVERYFEAIALTDKVAKVRTAALYLTDTTTLWWRRRFADMEKDICTIETWEDFRREIKRQFYSEDVAYLARKNMRRLKHTGSIRDYELRRRGVQDLATAMAIAESLTDYKRGDSSKDESLEDSHAMGRGDEVPRDHNAPKKESGKTSNVREGRDKAKRKKFTPKIKCFLCDGPHWARDCPKRKALNAMIEEREQEDEAHMGSMQLLGALQFNPKPSTLETSLLPGVQVKEEKGERAEVARTHMEEVTKGNVNSMDKRKQHSKHQKRTGLPPSEASWEKEVKSILAEQVTRRQGVPPVIEYLVQWKGLPKRQEEGSFWRLLEPSTLSHWWEECRRARLRGGHNKGSMSGSNVEETSEQTRWRETKPTARGRDKKDKSRDAVAMEARLAKVELAMADTQEGLDLIEQGMEKGLEDLREQIQDLRERVLVSQVQPVSHEEFVSFQGKRRTLSSSEYGIPRDPTLVLRFHIREHERPSRAVLDPSHACACVGRPRDTATAFEVRPHRVSGSRAEIGNVQGTIASIRKATQEPRHRDAQGLL